VTVIERNPQDIIAAIDIGSTKTTVLVGEVKDAGSLHYLGFGHAETKGVRKGMVSDLKLVTESIKAAVEQAEKMARVEVASATVSVGGPHIKGINSRSGLTVSNRQHEFTRDDVRVAVDRARSVPLPSDRTVLHLLPQEFLIDGHPGIQEPLGMTGSRLEVDLHLVTASASAVQSIVTAVNKAGIRVEDTVFEGVASGEMMGGLGPGERTIGCCLLDMGASSTEIVSYVNGAVVFTASVGLGGEHFTNDAAVGLRCSLEDAERLKCEFGHAVVTSVPSSNIIEIPASPSPRIVSQRFLSEILAPRTSELFELVRDTMRQGGVLDHLGAGVFLTGGVSRLTGIDEICRQVLRCQVRQENPVVLPRMPHELAVPEMATSIGLLAYTLRTRGIKRHEQATFKNKLMEFFAGA
jgi:cell division protein FtsA